MKKKIIISCCTFLLLGCLTKTSAQYTAAKDNKATANIPKPSKPDAGRALAPLSCGEPQRLNCEGLKQLSYKLCLPLGADMINAQKLTGNITLMNNETDGGNYYVTLYYSWKGNMATQQNIRISPSTPKVISFSMNAVPNYSGINNVQVWVQSCTKVFDPR